MKLFDERVAAMSRTRREFLGTPDTTEPDGDSNQVVPQEVQEKTSEEQQGEPSGLVVPEPVPDSVSEDENRNQSVERNQNTLDEVNQNVEQPAAKPVRPTVLDIVNTFEAARRRGETDSTTELQRNRLRVLQEEFGLTPNNNNEPVSILRATAESTDNRLRNTRHLTHLDWAGVEPGELTDDDQANENRTTEIQLNRLRNTRHLTHLSYNGGGGVEANDNDVPGEMTEAQRNKLKVLRHEYGLADDETPATRILRATAESTDNRLRNTQHLTHLNWEDVEPPRESTDDHQGNETAEIQVNRLRNTRHLTHLDWASVEDGSKEDNTETQQPLTDAQINRNRVMSHFYNRMDEELEPVDPRPPEGLMSDRQRNRQRNMGHGQTEQFDFEFSKPADRGEQQLRETPMSTTTDHFTASTHSEELLLLAAASCENTPFSEIQRLVGPVCGVRDEG